MSKYGYVGGGVVVASAMIHFLNTEPVLVGVGGVVVVAIGFLHSWLEARENDDS